MSVCYPDNAIWPDESVLTEDPELLESALTLAWTTLQTLSAHQIALCPVTVRPCRKRCATMGTYYIAPVLGSRGYQGSLLGTPFWPSVVNGQWTNIWCGHYDDCSCKVIQKITLNGPIGQIIRVQLDGVDLDPSAYRVDNGNELVRQDGQEWPVCQDMNLPDREVGTFSVTYLPGSAADTGVRRAAGVLAAEYLSALKGDDCRLPLGTVSMVRQGINIQVKQDFFINGSTGILEVDAVIRRFNPHAQRMPSRSWSPDRRPPRMTTVG